MTQSSASSRERLLNEVVAAYLQAVDAGRPPDRQRLIGQFPDFAAELQSFFADQDRLKRIAVPVDSTSEWGRLAAEPPPTDPVFLLPSARGTGRPSGAPEAESVERDPTNHTSFVSARPYDAE